MTEEEKAGANMVTARIRTELTHNFKYLDQQILELKAKQDTIRQYLHFLDNVESCVSKGIKP